MRKRGLIYINVLYLLILVSCNYHNTCSNNPSYSDSIVSLDVKYTQWACYCHNWSIIENKQDSIVSPADCFNILSVVDSVKLPFEYYVSGNCFKIKGHFSNEKKCYGIEDGGASIVLRYFEIEPIKPYYIWVLDKHDSLNIKLIN